MPQPLIEFRTTIEAAKAGFLDRQKFTEIVEKKKRKAFVEIGAYIRESMRNDIKEGSRVNLAKGRAAQMEGGLLALDAFKSIHGRAPKIDNTSTPGKAPRSRTGLLKDKIFFWSPDANSVAIGPARTNGKVNVPEILEFGGIVKGRSILSRLGLSVAVDKQSGDNIVGMRSDAGHWFVVGVRNGKPVSENKRGRIIPYGNVNIMLKPGPADFRIEPRPYAGPQLKKPRVLSFIRRAFNNA